MRGQHVVAACAEIHIRRASDLYTLSVLLPVTMLTILSFGVFFMSFEVGERLGCARPMPGRVPSFAPRRDEKMSRDGVCSLRRLRPPARWCEALTPTPLASGSWHHAAARPGGE
jgi:hypothetical protein